MKAFWMGTGTMNQRILELAIEELERQKAAIEAEIATIRRELKGTPSVRLTKTSAMTRGKRRVINAAQRKAQSERMKRYWAAKRLTNPKTRKASSKAISEAMRAYWAKRKAAGKNFKAK